MVTTDRAKAERPRGAAGNLARDAIRAYGVASARFRPLPEFLIIGAKRGGSTSLYFDLMQHPNVCPLFPGPIPRVKPEPTKGVHFFDANFQRGEQWYRSYMPSSAARRLRGRSAGGPVIAGEGSPYYQYHPLAAERAVSLLPDAKIIAVLRDPVMRTFSHWKERVRNGIETLEFVDALAAEDERLGNDEQRLIDEPDFYSYAHEHQSYAHQSEYDLALARWFAVYPREQILIVAAEDYYRDPRPPLDRVQQFLGLPRRDIATGEVRNAAGGDRLDPHVQSVLSARFADHNQQLEKLTGQSFGWS